MSALLCLIVTSLSFKWGMGVMHSERIRWLVFLVCRNASWGFGRDPSPKMSQREMGEYQ